MADRKQRLINFHTSGVTNMPLAKDVHLGEIVVRHADEKPELLIKQTNGEFAVIPASGAVASAIASAIQVSESSIDGKISQVEGSLSGHVEAFEQYKTEAAAEFATKEEVSGHVATLNSNINAAKTEVYTSATTFATSAVTAAKTELEGAIADVESKVNEANSGTSILEEYIKETYATSADTEAAIALAKDEAIGAASAYTDAEVAEAKAAAIAAASAYTDSKISEVSGEIESLESGMESGFTAIRTDLSATTEDLTELINNKVAVAYRYQGSCTYAELASKPQEVGYVWNVTDANGNFPAGTNYAWNGSEWDALGGSVDLSPYAKVADFNDYKEEVRGEFEDVRSEIADANSGVSNLETYVKETYATSADTEAAIAKAKNEAIGAASAYTDAREAAVYASATSFATSAVSSAKTELQGNINGVSSNLEALSGSVVSVKAVADEAVQTASADEASQVQITKEGTNLKFDFSNLYIDCGEF